MQQNKNVSHNRQLQQNRYKLSKHQIIKFCGRNFPAKYDASIGNWMMIGGMPNVGKSSIINSIRSQVLKETKESKDKKKVAKQQNQVCTTKSLTGFRVCRQPLAYLIDSPGLMVPRFIDDESALKLSLVGAVKEKFIGYEHLMEYMLWVLNKNNQQGAYMRYYGLKGGDRRTNAQEMFMEIRQKYQKFNYQAAFDMILNDFREGHLGKITFDNLDNLDE